MKLKYVPNILPWINIFMFHYCDVTMGTNASHIASLTIVYSTVYSGADQRKHQSSASLAFVRGIHRRPVNSPHKWPVTRKMFPFDDVIMYQRVHLATIMGHSMSWCVLIQFFVLQILVAQTNWGKKISCHWYNTIDMYFVHQTAMYRKISNIRRTKSPNWNVSRLVVQLSLPNPMKPGVKSRMKM